MEQLITLSDRLQQVSYFLPKGAIFADIGSDHAYLPCHVCMLDKNARAIAGEINKGPYNSAKKTVRACQLTNRVDVRLGDGLEIITADEIRQLVIAGMGGKLIRSILEAGKDKLKLVERIIAQPNVNARGVRKWLITNNYNIKDEAIVEENGHSYEIIVADMCENGPTSAWTERELLFGPILLKKRPDAFFKKWRYEQNKLSRIIEQMKRATVRNEVKIQFFEQDLQWIQEVLQDGENDS